MDGQSNGQTDNHPGFAGEEGARGRENWPLIVRCPFKCPFANSLIRRLKSPERTFRTFAPP